MDKFDETAVTPFGTYPSYDQDFSVASPTCSGIDTQNSQPLRENGMGAEARIDRLEAIVAQIGTAILATTETIERLTDRVDVLVVQVQQQSQQVQQQGYQIFALSDAVQTLAETQESTLQRLTHLTYALQRLVDVIESPEEESNPD